MRLFRLGDPTFLGSIAALPPPDEVTLVAEDETPLTTESSETLIAE
jgi:hypothetical protein